MIYISFIGSSCEGVFSMYREGQYTDRCDFFKQWNGTMYKFNVPGDADNMEICKQSHVVVVCPKWDSGCGHYYCKLCFEKLEKCSVCRWTG